ncbi:hypothetical protein MMC26_006490 [Xylographa opegraphella]|nr:hypothetical protein [Xylographa opegraphella]
MDTIDKQTPDRVYLPPRMPPLRDRHLYPQAHVLASTTNRGASNRVRIQPASPEVISSLISSLSAISSPVQEHFERQSQICLVDAPIPTMKTAGGSVADDGIGSTEAGTGFGMDYGAYNQPAGHENRGQLYPDDAAIPPVIRTSKPPSGLSPITASKRNPLASSNSPGWMEAQTNTYPVPEIPRSIGSPSIKPGPRASSTSLRSFGSETKSALTGQRSLNFKDSKGKMREIDRERKKRPVARIAGSEKASVRHSRNTSLEYADKAGPSRTPSKVVEDLCSPLVPQKATSIHFNKEGDSHTATTDNDFGGMGARLIIPKRDSSMRHSTGPSNARQKRTSHQSDHTRRSEGLTFEDRVTSMRVVEKVSDDPEEDEVAKRIKELKAQKEIRDRENEKHDVSQRRESSLTPSTERYPFPSTQPAADSSDLQPIEAEETRRARLLKEQQLPLRSLSVNAPRRSTSGQRRSISAKRLSKRLSSDSTRKFESQYNAQVNSLSPLYSPTRQTSPTSLEINRGTYLNPISQGTKNAQHDGRPSTSDSIDEEVENYLSLARLSQKIHHPQTGRIISFSDVGDPEGYVVICCVGMGLTRYLSAFYDELAMSLKLRLVTLDRPGVGESEPYADGTDTPLGWPDDVRAVCQHLKISRFSILAHSAGVIYALATALRMPQHIRGRLHLLAPWIPPSQLTTIGNHQEPVPVTALPYSQRLLRSLPTPFLKAANSNFFSATSTSITTSLPKSPRRTKRKSLTQDAMAALSDSAPITTITNPNGMEGGTSLDMNEDDQIHGRQLDFMNIKPGNKERQTEYDTRLTHAIWELATANANPAVDLLVCLERRQEIGFRYVDITKAVVIHHGSRDSRVPVENVKWLGKTMRRCEVRVLDGEGHGLMASAAVMGSVLTEISKEWEDWNLVVKGKRQEKGRVAL